MAGKSIQAKIVPQLTDSTAAESPAGMNHDFLMQIGDFAARRISHDLNWMER